MLNKIKQLREQTLASVAECKSALEETKGDLEKAIEILQHRGSILASKKASREVKEGLIEAYIHSNAKIGVLLELNCETDFVAKNETFKELAHNLAMHIAAMNPAYTRLEDIPENISIENKNEICLLTQSFIKNPDQTIQELINDYIAKLGENIKIGKFTRYEI